MKILRSIKNVKQTSMKYSYFYELDGVIRVLQSDDVSPILQRASSGRNVGAVTQHILSDTHVCKRIYLFVYFNWLPHDYSNESGDAD